MARSKREKPVYEFNSGLDHPDYEIKNTQVSDYILKYAAGKVENLPQNSRPEITDNRTPDQMMDEPCLPSGADVLDVMMEVDKYKERFDNAVADVKATQSDLKRFKDATAAINDKNTPVERLREAYAVLDELEKNGKITRARKI